MRTICVEIYVRVEICVLLLTIIYFTTNTQKELLLFIHNDVFHCKQTKGINIVSALRYVSMETH